VNETDPEPTRDELLAMAYFDGELAQDARRAFEERLAREPGLAREVTALERLHGLARHSVGPEPMDGEWQRLEREPLHRAGVGLGFALVFVGGMGLAGWLVLALVGSELSLALKLVCGALIAGAALLLLATLRARLRTLPYDPYTDVRR
jgi:anti-sigma factor RsiW